MTNPMWKTALTKIGADERESVRGHDLQKLITGKSFVESVFLLLTGKLPTKKETGMLNALFVACLDHGVGAPSATVARTVASTGNSLHTAVAAGILTTGEHHGGAIEGAARFFSDHVGEKNVKKLVAELKELKVRIPGYGHKVLTHDHRSDTLFTVAKKMGFYSKHCSLAVAVEKELNKVSSKPLPLNIDGSMAAIIMDMGFDWRLAKGFFLIGRMPGLVAHAFEQSVSGEGVKRINEDAITYVGG